MPFRFYFLLVIFTLIFLSYPGDSLYFSIFAYHPELFAKTSTENKPVIHPIPILRNQYPPATTAESVFIVDLPSFTPIYERNIHEHLYPASTTKIVTALVASDLYKPDDIATIKRATAEGQIMYLQQNERITIENLFYGMLVYSANDAAYAIADQYGFDAFITKMNEKAQAIGMKDSHFRNPAGLDDVNQYSSAYDLALASRELLSHNYLKKFVSTKEITISDIDFKYFHKLTNVNKLLGEVQGIGGLKTGYTEAAGENLVSYYRKNNHEFIVVILKSQDRFEDTKSVVKWIDENVDYINVEK
jgi:serine-type D-Ala-D-Ala carboxypeptidase (penicillin-binding protein 5/6)